MIFKIFLFYIAFCCCVLPRHPSLLNEIKEYMLARVNDECTTWLLITQTS